MSTSQTPPNVPVYILVMPSGWTAESRKTKARSPRIALVLIAVVLCALAALADPIEKIKPTGYVTDLAGVIDGQTAQRLEALCTEVEQKTGAQIAVVTVKSLDGRTVEDYAVELFKHLGVGHKDNRGILLLVAPNDRHYRFEVGYSLEPIINDARAGDVGREMVPYLRRNDYSGAIYLGTRRVADMIAADRGVTLTGAPPPREHISEPANTLPFWVVPLGFVGFFLLMRLLNRGGRRRRSGWWIGTGGFGGWGGGGFGGGGFGGSSGGFGGFGGGSSGGGGASGSW
ncbi:MAG TPA: TPM domain-containing protein [Terriglobia bacterium]|nr:TPM domain-containing protein [Terriglobia bacterium]